MLAKISTYMVILTKWQTGPKNMPPRQSIKSDSQDQLHKWTSIFKNDLIYTYKYTWGDINYDQYTTNIVSCFLSYKTVCWYVQYLFWSPCSVWQWFHNGSGSWRVQCSTRLVSVVSGCVARDRDKSWLGFPLIARWLAHVSYPPSSSAPRPEVHRASSPVLHRQNDEIQMRNVWRLLYTGESSETIFPNIAHPL